MTKVSILIPCYNAERWVRQAIQSALDQTHEDKEVIVVDDGSTDGSLEIIKSFGSQIQWKSGPNQGGNVARNRLLNSATGEWLQYLDADDYLLPEKLTGQVTSISAKVDVIYSPTIWIHFDADGQELDQRHFQIPPPHDPWKHLIMWRLPQTGGALWRRTAIQDVGGWKEDQPCCQEHELYFRLLNAEKNFRYSKAKGAIYRQWTEETVCRRNPLQTITKRMEVIDRTESTLNRKQIMTPELENAIASTRYECARSAYQYDKPSAIEIARKARHNNPSFRLPDRLCFPSNYRRVFQCFGFQIAEHIAAVSRRLSKPEK